MTVKQVTKVLERYGYSLDSWIPFNEVSIIFLDFKGRLYTNKKDTRFNFGSDSILRITHGTEKSDGSFVDGEGNTDNYKTYDFFDFSRIFGFISSVEVLPPFRILRKTIKKA